MKRDRQFKKSVIGEITLILTWPRRIGQKTRMWNHFIRIVVILITVVRGQYGRIGGMMIVRIWWRCRIVMLGRTMVVWEIRFLGLGLVMVRSITMTTTTATTATVEGRRFLVIITWVQIVGSDSCRSVVIVAITITTTKWPWSSCKENGRTSNNGMVYGVRRFGITTRILGAR